MSDTSAGGQGYSEVDHADCRFVKSRFKGKSKSGAELDAAAEQVWEVRDGKILRLENKPDPEAWATGWS